MVALASRVPEHPTHNVSTNQIFFVLLCWLILGPQVQVVCKTELDVSSSNSLTRLNQAELSRQLSGLYSVPTDNRVDTASLPAGGG